MIPLLVDNVRKRYATGGTTVEALRGVSLQVQRGQFLAIMGASGSGKSTLLHLMAGLATADEGKILVNGTDLGSLSDYDLTLFRRRHIGLVFQSFNLMPSLNARQNVALPLLLDGIAPADATSRADALLDRLGLARRAHHRPDALSGGEQQRIAIARALITNPAVLFADEPTGNLDRANSALVCELLRDLARDGTTIVMVTHEPAVATYASRAMVLADGEISSEFDVRPGMDAAQISELYVQGPRATT